jgi:hypothetical protein
VVMIMVQTCAQRMNAKRSWALGHVIIRVSEKRSAWISLSVFGGDSSAFKSKFDGS